MNYLFTHAPWIVVGTSKDSYASPDLENRLKDITNQHEGKRDGSIVHEHEERAEL